MNDRMSMINKSIQWANQNKPTTPSYQIPNNNHNNSNPQDNNNNNNNGNISRDSMNSIGNRDSSSPHSSITDADDENNAAYRGWLEKKVKSLLYYTLDYFQTFYFHPH